MLPKAELQQQIEELKPGDHLCCLYHTEETHRAILSPFLHHGLERGEKVIYIADTRTAETILGYLQTNGLDVETCLHTQQLEVLTSTESYTRDGTFDPDRMLDLLQTEAEKALDQGFAAFRLTGEMSWALRGPPGSDRLIEYEARLNTFFTPSHPIGSQSLGLCQYNWNRFDSAILLDVLRTHPIAVIGTCVYSNFYYIPPSELLSEDPARAELDRWIDNLAQVNKTRQELQTHRAHLEELVALRTAKLEHEIAERARVEKALKESEEYYRLLAEHATDMISVHAPDGAYTYASPACRSLMGYPPEELIGHSAYEFFHPDDLPAIRQSHDKVLESSATSTVEYRLQHRDGHYRWVETTSKMIPDPQTGQVEAIIAVTRDVTPRKQAEEAVRLREQRLQALSQQLVDAQETERRRVARELHDVIGQALTAVKINLQTAHRLLDTAESRTQMKASLEETIDNVEETLQQVRDLSVDLRPSLLDDLGLVPALRWYLNRQAKQGGFSAQFTSDAAVEKRLPSHLEIVCFRILQEALTNVVRHAQAQQVSVAVGEREGVLTLTIADDGRGFDVQRALEEATQGASTGLSSMKERASLAGGRLEITSSPSGTRIEARFPLPPTRTTETPAP